MITGRIIRASPTPTVSGVRGVGPTFFQMYGGGVNPSLSAKNVWGPGGFPLKMRGIESENVCFVGGGHN